MDITEISLYIILIILAYIIYVIRVILSIEKKMLNIDANIENAVENLTRDTGIEEGEENTENQLGIIPPKKHIKKEEESESKLKKEIDPKNYFILKRGEIIKNIDELINSLKDMPDDVFEHHVNLEKNDFADWVRHVYDEEELAKKISTKKNKHDMKNLLKKAKKKQ